MNYDGSVLIRLSISELGVNHFPQLIHLVNLR